MTAPKIFTPEYYAHMAALERASWWNAGMRDLADRLLSGSGLPPRGKLLDVGCGSGQTMAWFRERWPEWTTVGLDVAFVGLQAARAGTEERVVAASALEIPLPDASVDAVITLDVLQHLPLGGGDGRALAEIRRVLRPGGLLLVRTNAQSWPRTRDDPQHNFHKYTRRELRAKIEAFGFRVRRIGRLNAVLGLGEIARECRANTHGSGGYQGLVASIPQPGAAWRVKRSWLRLEGRLVAAGLSLPLGRTLVALAEARDGSGTE